eukprot:NODE_6117_length_657_cov_52.739623_g6094_i0.p1 GENE.NODE_6117_length_657_cov_52.739623_g6094_i0~~NODE_6117_length_657_cov_52.739623_g6094_i0.p1  ORF type:complete len:164 (+),score=13.49 NODE_6117_length_657_cov_52.739623_g6094_i0:98-589(+)
MAPPSLIGKIKARASGYKDEQDGVLHSQCPSMSLKQRLTAFAICCCCGFIFAIISWFAVLTNWVLFGITMTFGNICSLSGTFFLVGPKRQLKQMFKPVRVGATIGVFAFMAATLCAALIPDDPIPLLVIIFCICQYLAMIWYGLSYIPFARTAVKKMFTSLVT